jgi:cytochrome P450
MEPLLGEGLLTSEGDLWRRQRRIMAKEFHSSKIDQFLVSIHQSTQNKVAELSSVKAPLDITTEFNALTFEIAGSLFFGSKMEGQSLIAQTSLYTETERVNARIRRLWNFPLSFPTGENLRGNKAVKNLRGIVSGILNSTSNHAEKQNVLSKLVSYKDENGQGLPTKLISDEVMTLMLAGHETTSNGLSWASFLLAEHPEWILKLREELSEYGKTPEELTKEDLTKLPLLDAVWKESLRLYPPIPIISRQTLEEDVIGGFKVPAGVSVQCCPYVTHRDERFWNQPNTFMPERFVDRVISRDDCTYFPFAKGPRACIGEELANVEGLLILSYMTHYFDWGLKKGFKPEPHHHLTLRSENGMWLNLKKSVK